MNGNQGQSREFQDTDPLQDGGNEFDSGGASSRSP
jgi:hypothetical protein